MAHLREIHAMQRSEAPAVHAAIAKVQKALGATGLAKSRTNQQQGYAFRGIDDVLNALSGALVDAGLYILPRMRERVMVELESKKGDPLYNVTLTAEFTIVAVADGSRVKVRTYGEAMDSADKATNKAMSAAFKYMALLAFCVPLVGEDGDADATTHEPKARSKPAPEGYGDWIDRLKVAAVGGKAKLSEAYKTGTVPMADHLRLSQPTLIDELRAVAAEADGAAPPAAAEGA